MDDGSICVILENGRVTLKGSLLRGSNYTFIAKGKLDD